MVTETDLLAPICDDTAGDVVGFASFIGSFIHRYRIAHTVGGPKLLALTAQVVGDHRIGGIQNRLGRAVILFQPDDPGSAVLLFKIQNIFDGGAAEAVNALVVVANHTQIFITSSQQAGQQILQMVGILVLVHQAITEFSLIIGADILIFLQKANGVQDNIVEIHRIVVYQPLLVLFISPGGMNGTVIPGKFSLLQHFIRASHPVFFLADDAQHGFRRKHLFIQAHVPDDIFHNALAIRGVINGEMLAQPHPLRIAAQNTAAGGVECHGPDILALGAQHSGKPVFQFVGRFICKCNGNDAPGRHGLHSAKKIRLHPVRIADGLAQTFQEQHIFFGYRVRHQIGIAGAAESDQIGNAVNEHRGLAAACACKQQQRPIRRKDGLLLHGV